MRILLLRLALIPHHIWAALFAVAVFIDRCHLTVKQQWRFQREFRRKNPVYGWKGDPAGGNYFEAEEQ